MAGKATEVLLEQISEIERTNLSGDRRRIKGKNRYTAVVIESYSHICELMNRGETLNNLFRILQEQNIFDETADVSAFYRAFHREKFYREKNGVPVSRIPSNKSSERISNVVYPSLSQHPDGIEYEQDGKKYVSLDGQVREIPKGYRFLRGRICPNMDDQRIESKQERLYNFEDYPRHIQEAINESSRNGRVLEDAAKNKKLVEEWKASLEKTEDTE